MYHHVCPPDRIPAEQSPLEGWQYCISPANFRQQLLTLRGRGWEFTSLADYVAGLTERPMWQKRVAVTFDDGWVDNFNHAVPILSELQIPGTIFVVSGDLPDVPANRRMTTAQLQNLSKYGISIGSHTQTHPCLPRLNDSDLQRELCGSREQLEQISGRLVDTFAYPGGRFDSRVVAEVEAAGYTAACSVVGWGGNHLGSRFWLYRDVFTDPMRTLRDRLRMTPLARRCLAGRAERRIRRLLAGG